jgi:hypothetical protein
MMPLELLLTKLPNAKKSGNGWSARCPAHEDRRASLSIGQARDGTALVKCHAGCSAAAITAALGLKLADLFPPKAGSASSTNGKAASNGQAFATARDAVAELERKLGKRSAAWTYHDAQGEPVGVVVRWDKPDSKTIRPVARHGDGWHIGAMPEPRPLYRLPDLRDAPRVVVCEGEKCADAARSLGFVATTSAGGSQAASKTDWRPLAGKEVWILPDNDAPGRQYAETVADLLTKLTPTPTVRIIELPGLPEGGDLADVLSDEEWCGLPLGDSAEPADLAALLERLAKATTPWQALGADEELVYHPFPTESLPDPIRGFVAAGAKAIGCDASFLALPLLTAIAASIGNTRRLELKRGWYAPAILWTAVVGESGTAKTPAFKLVMHAVRERQRKALKRHKEEMKRFLVEYEMWERDYLKWKGAKGDVGEPPEKPEPPAAERFIVSDTTVEALAPILLTNLRGLLLARDELAGWIGSFDRYAGKNKTGADAPQWLSTFNAENIIVDRKTGTQKTIFVPHAAVCVTGGIQPGILQRALSPEHRESGLAARLLLAYPPRKAKRWTDAGIEANAEDELVELFERLYERLQPEFSDGEPRPALVRLTPEAKTAWVSYYNAHAAEQVDLTGDMAAAWSKLEEYAARLALIIHYVRWAAGDVANERMLDVTSMRAGIELANWFKNEARRIYLILDESDTQRDQRRLVEWIERRGGTVAIREVQAGCRWLRAPGAAEAALEELVKAGRGTWEQSQPGQRGKPARRFRLVTPTGCQRYSSFPRENANIVDVDNVDAAETQPMYSPEDLDFPFGFNNLEDPDGERLFRDYHGLPD